MAPVVLVTMPDVLLVTCREKLHDDAAFSEAFERLMDVEPGPVPCKFPPQLLKGPVPTTVRPASRLSVTAIPLSELPLLGLLMLKSSVVTPPSGMVELVYDRVMVGGAA